MLKILVTGGGGYLGSILVPKLLGLGHKVSVVDNFMYGQSSLNHCCFVSSLSVTNGDVRDKSLMRKLTSSADVIFPLAAYVGAPLCAKDPFGAHSINNESIKSLLDMLSTEQNVIMPTTNSAYGSGQEGEIFTEKSKLNPLSLYAKDKVEVEERILDRENSISFRLATVFGMSPRMRIDLLVNDFTYRAVKDKYLVLFEGSFKRNYIHVRDVTKAFIHAIENFETMKNQIYNVGLSDANLSKVELCELIKTRINDFVFFEESFNEDPDQRNYIVSNKKLEDTNYKPDVSLEDGIVELIKGYAMLNNKKYGNV